VRILALSAAFLVACTPSPRHREAAHAPERPAPPPPAVMDAGPSLGAELKVAPDLAAKLTVTRGIPDSAWSARTPAGWTCKTPGVRHLECEAPGTPNRVEWTEQAAEGKLTPAERVAALVSDPGYPADVTRIQASGAVGVLMRTHCMKDQCSDPILSLFWDDASGPRRLDAHGNCDRTECDDSLTLAVLSSTHR
jgi:hypothetical protein